ncbi:hypothetical protein BU23DRAFT_205888 [Bimuria novae-zelandiae CBS 107.79]|uniref:Uncharacterized protein n=1 Tax=Bimuria novae-zelandiae CBS 107.79 TaxID=1447943 RepID=A0A6A5V6L9_9PLEO|nr:hypothetical protein BU23DRAFT_205888 [Bimuria novae-zelandiae CBS 107.79]
MRSGWGFTLLALGDLFEGIDPTAGSDRTRLLSGRLPVHVPCGLWNRSFRGMNFQRDLQLCWTFSKAAHYVQPSTW